MFPKQRKRRLRNSDSIRKIVSEINLTVNDLITPIFLTEGEKIKEEILKVNSKINIHIGKYEPVNIDEFNKEDKYLVFSGIGNHKTFI